MQSFTSLTAVLVALATGCAASTSSTTAASPATPTGDTSRAAVAGSNALVGPVADPLVHCPSCTINRHPPSGSREILAVASLDAPGSAAILAIETPRGWYVDVPAPRAASATPLFSHHQPRSVYFDGRASRIEGERVRVRLVDSSSVYYPGQGARGSTSSQTWSDRTCEVHAGGGVTCGPYVGVAHRSCRHDDGPQTCTGDEPAR